MTEPSADVLLAIEVSSGYFYQIAGQPVWPVRNRREREALERMVSTLGGTVQFVTGAEEKLLTGSELVVGLGAGAHEHARLYAHLTHRRSITLERIEELGEVSGVAVVVTTFAHINERLLDLLYDRDPIATAPGLIFSYADEDLSLQVLAKSAALHCNHASFQRRRVDVNPTIDFGTEVSPEYSFVGGRAEPSEFREALSCCAGLLTLYTHSDGIDAYLRKDLVLCPIGTGDSGEHPAMLPSCVASGICHRCSRPMSEVIGTDVLLAPEIVKAHVFIYCVCWGLYPPQGVHSPAFSLSRRFLQSFTIGALLTSWEINIQTLPVIARLFHDVARGLPLGEALALHLSSQEARSRHHKLCLIGDPSMRLSCSDTQNPLEGIQAVKNSPGPSERCMAGLGLLRLMVNNYLQAGDTSANLTATLAEYETMLVGGGRYNPTLAAIFRREMLDFFANQDTMLSKSWARFVDATQVLPDKIPCPICARRTIARMFTLRIPGAVPRRETMCPSCGSIEDCSVDRRITMAVEPGGLIQLFGALPATDWCAKIVVERFFTRENYSWEWPSALSGEPLGSFRVPKPWPTVPFRLSIIMVYGDCEFSVLGCLYRGSLPEVQVIS
jgi:hypothetical protein